MNPWWITGIFAAIALVGLYLWWHGRHSKKVMEEKPQPKTEPKSKP